MTDDLIDITPRLEVTRRDAIKLLAAGIAALEAGCLEQPGEQQIVPYVVDPPEHRPGSLVRYAGALALDGFGLGVLVSTSEGRPIKIDGNPAHPATLGGSLPWVQARILDLYDPQRSRAARLGTELVGADAVLRRLRDLPPGPVWIVMPPQTSPTVAGLLARIAQRHELHVVYDAPLGREAIYGGSTLAFGKPLEPLPDLAHADVIAARRDPRGRMSRLWVCEPMQTPTGTLADETLAIRASDVPAVLVCLADRLAAQGLAAPRIGSTAIAAARARLGIRIEWVTRLAEDLVAHRGSGVLLVGARQPAAAHALARILDHALGNATRFVEPALLEPVPARTIADLMRAKPGAVIVIDTDPVYSAPHLPVAEHLKLAPFSLYLGMYATATATACQAHLPMAHDLETWTDPRAADGTLSIGQPAIRPRFAVTSAIDVLGALLGEGRDARTLVHDQLRALLAPADPLATFDARWTDALRAGVVAGTAAPDVAVAPAWTGDAELAALLVAPAGIEIALACSAQLHDGRFAPNAWLQELPHPITKQTWGNAAMMSAATAKQLGVTNDDRVRLATAAGELVLPAVIVTGAADDSITVEVGHGQRAAAVPIANAVGANAYQLRERSLIATGSAAAAGGTEPVIRTQHTTEEHGRDIAPAARLAQFRLLPDLTSSLRGEQPSLLPPQNEDGVQWGMSIDTNICTGCSACMVACQAENNIPTVGPEGVAQGRHMSWIRIDRYVHDDGGVVNEPMACQHCEDAPCEYVCPVNATVHSHDGLNEQVYNRCVGTRFCSNNCPYKVRRFNWFAYEREDSSALQYNPDVTVRSRGVMEKCTYCVQRIRRVEHAALVEKRPIRPGEVTTACQDACPTAAIQFGYLREQDTAFAAMRRDSRRFEALHDLGTRPRTQYLAKITNPKERG